MEKKILFIPLVLILFFLSFRITMSWKSEKKIISQNSNVSKQLENLELDSILLYKRILYSKYNSFQEIDESSKISLQYDIANYDIDLMPIVISNSVIICQTHSLKILNNNLVYEYKCNNQIQCITYPKKENNSLIFYVIKFDSTKKINNVPTSERKWLLQKIVFDEGKFIEEMISYLHLPDTYLIKPLNSEISFFTYLNKCFYVVLTNNNGNSAIYQFSKNGKMMNKAYDGYIIVPNNFSDSDLWYIQKDSKSKNYLIKNDNVIVELNKYIMQGHFINDNNIEFFGYNTSDIGSYDFINGLYAPFYFAEIYSVTKKQFINGYYKEVLKKRSIFKDKIRRDNILVIF